MRFSETMVKNGGTTEVNTMRGKFTGAGFLLLMVVWAFVALIVDFNPVEIDQDRPQAAERPNDWFGKQRAYPNGTIPMDRVTKAMATAREMRREEFAKSNSRSQPRWTQVGPTNVPGRVLAVDVHPSDPDTIYIGSAMGGVHKSTDRGRTWTPIFDEVGILPIGAIEIDPTDPQTIYVGTGEAGPLHYFLLGNGVYKSTDGGATWNHIGLADSGTVGRIVVDPQDPDRVFVAAAGRLMKGPDGSRGLYRSEDGGATWERVLSINPATGIADLAFHSDSGVMLAGAWEYRWGINSGIWRSEDRGETWTDISGAGGLPARSSQHRKITVTMGSTHTTAYAAYCGQNSLGTGRFAGLWRSDDLGLTWRRVDRGGALDMAYSHSHWPYSSGSYFGGAQVSPTDPELVFVQGVSLWRSRNGGWSWDDIYGAVGMNTGLPHIDHHDLRFLDTDDDVFYLGCDGGVWYTEDQGDSWEALDDLANTQFYRIEIDYLNPSRIYGGSQDNGTIVSPTGSMDDWHMIQNGDGGPVIVDYTNSDIVYVTWFGFPIYKSTNGGASFREVMNGIDPGDDVNLEVVPFEMDANDPRVLYYGTDRVYKTVDAAEYWQPISPNLCGGWSFLTAIGLAASDSQVVYAGGANGELWVTTNGGGDWQQSFTPVFRWVTRLAVDPDDAAIAYVTLSGYETAAITTPHIYRTADFGRTWTDISGNLPDAPVNDVIIDPFHQGRLYVGTDVGVFKTNDLGAHWTAYGSGMPINVVTDLDYHPPTRTLVAGTYGRSIFKTTTGPQKRRAPRRVRPVVSSKVRASKGRG
jgi:photosystem II stability/assembly factor-like uncharacterized protein